MNASGYFFGLIAVGAGLFVIALLLPKFKKSNLKNSNQNNSNALNELLALCQNILGDEYQFTKSDKFITIIKNNQKIALLTLDNTLKNHSRKLGESVVINFRRVPNKSVLEKTFIQERIIKLN